MSRRVLGLCLIFLLSLSCASADRYAPYEFGFDFIPPWGNGDFISGAVYASGERCNETDLCVKLFLRVDGDGTWWPKPTTGQPFAAVDADSGLFIIPFNTGGDDIHATELALMLVRKSDAAILDFDEANAAALCVTTIYRDPDGQISLSHSYRAESAWLNDIGMDVGFYTQSGTSPGSFLSEAHLKELLRAAAVYTCDVRFYSTTGEVAKAYPIAHDIGLSVAATAWLDGGENDLAELDALIDLCNNGLATTAIVGNEVLYNNRMSEEALLADIAYVRAGITDPDIPVTTAETPGILLSSFTLRNACDVLAVNIHPFWNGISANDAEQDLCATVEAFIANSDGKPVIVSETGWPTDGADTAGEAAQTTAIQAAYDLIWQYSDVIQQVYWFSLADEPWKDTEENGVGAHWGLLDNNLNAKDAVYSQYWSWTPDYDYMTELPPMDDLLMDD